jgi:S-adenosyl-L-methionine hydrolase (adenosine-forming)
LQTQLITLTSDFGTNDGSIMMLKLAISKTLPLAAFTDFSHTIKPYNVAHAAYLVANLYPQFDEGSIHLILVNLFATNDNNLLAVKLKGQIFIGVDNGLFDYLINDEFAEIISIGKFHSSHFFYQHIAKCINEISANKNIWLDAKNNTYHRLNTRKEYEVVEQTISGSVWIVNDFGNLITNIHRSKIEHILEGKKIKINFGYKDQIEIISQFINEVSTSNMVAFYNQFGYLEIAIRGYNLSKLFNIKEESIIKITYS